MLAWCLTPRRSDTKLPPRAAFTAQIIGTLFGSILNYSEYLFFLDYVELAALTCISYDELYHRQST